MRATVRAGSLRSFSLVQDEGLGRNRWPDASLTGMCCG